MQWYRLLPWTLLSRHRALFPIVQKLFDFFAAQRSWGIIELIFAIE
jgi:hypothetical protein